MSNNIGISNLEMTTREQSVNSGCEENVNKTKDNEEVLDDIATERKKRKLLWKIDLFILPILVMVYFFGSMVSQSPPYV